MKKRVRVRFAPSPTGYLHVGGARTALFNYLFTKSKNGEFILRIEDTDFKRSSEEMSKEILKSLGWLEIHWDEGPFYQSDRLKFYRLYAERLIKEKKAYYCFCTPEEIEERRKKSGKESWKYDRKCLNLKEEEIKKNLEDGKPHAIRFLVPEGKIEFEDLIHGKLSFDNSQIEDFVLIKSDGTPTYHLSVVVDDYLMKITHVIRGDDHISNTPKQILLYKAFGFDPPVFAHLPLILGPDGKKLSKRHGVTSVLEYKRMGYTSEAMVNFLAKLSWNPGEDKPFFTIEEMIKRFSLKKISKNSPIFDTNKLDFINSKVISALGEKEIYRKMKECFNERGENFEIEEDEKTLKAISLLKTRMRNLVEFYENLKLYLNTKKKIQYDEDALKKYVYGKNNLKTYMNELYKEFEKIEDEKFNKETTEKALREKAQRLEIKAGELIHPLRVALIGKRVSPGIFEVVEFLGKELTLLRIKSFIEFLDEQISSNNSGV